MPERPPTDHAWVEVGLAMEPGVAVAFCAEDAERLFRINPFYQIVRWRRTAPGAADIVLRNLGNDRIIETRLSIEPLRDGLRVAYAQGLKASTTFRVATSAAGAVLTVTDEYRALPESERLQRLAEVDRSLTQWGRELQRYLMRWGRWNWCAPWRCYMARVWLPMKPPARRIAFMLTIFTAAEFAAFLAVLAIFLLA